MELTIEVSQLMQGDTIDVAECESITEVTSESKQYPFALMQLAKQIETELWLLGKQWTVCTTGGSVRILTNAEAIAYNAATFDAGRRKMRLAHKRSIAIDASSLTDELRQQLMENIARQGRMLSAMRTTKQPIEVQAVKKITPRRS
jgi:hypothetical protein